MNWWFPSFICFIVIFLDDFYYLYVNSVVRCLHLHLDNFRAIYTKKVSFPRSTAESVYSENTVTKTEETSNYQELNIKEDMAYQNYKENITYENLTLQWENGGYRELIYPLIPH